MNYSNCCNKIPYSALHMEYKHHEPLGSANNVQIFQKTLQHLSSKKIKSKTPNLFRNTTDDIIFTYITLCQDFMLIKVQSL